MSNNFKKLLQDSTVRVKAANSFGTGFFVAPGFILTCKHVIEDIFDEDNCRLSVVWNKEEKNAEVIGTLNNSDIALLSVEITNHLCVFLDQQELTPDEPLYTSGYPISKEGCFSITLNYSGDYNGESNYERLFTLKGENINEGCSGSPLLSWNSKKVCGMIAQKRSLAQRGDFGGMAVPAELIISQWPMLIGKVKAVQTIWNIRGLGVLGEFIKSFDKGVTAVNPWQLSDEDRALNEASIEIAISAWSRKIHHSLRPTKTDIEEVLNRIDSYLEIEPDKLNKYFFLPKNDMRNEVLITFATQNFHIVAPFDDCVYLFLFVCTNERGFLNLVNAELIQRKFLDFMEKFTLKKLVEIYAR